MCKIQETFKNVKVLFDFTEIGCQYLSSSDRMLGNLREIMGIKWIFVDRNKHSTIS